MADVRACPACRSETAAERGVKGDFHIMVCSDCRSIFTSSLPSGDCVENYDAYYDEENLSVPDFIKERLREIVGSFEPFKGENSHLLDIGFGAGSLLDEAKLQGWNVRGIEVSQPAFEQARRNGFDVYCGTIRDAAYPDSFFDVVCASEILEHLPEPEAELHEIARILRPGGLFWGTTPSARSLSFRLMGPQWTTISPPEHTQLYSPSGIEKLLSDAGFVDVRVTTSGLNVSEVANYYRGRTFRDGDERVQSSYALNQQFTSSPARRLAKRTLNAMINTFGIGDSIKIRARKG